MKKQAGKTCHTLEFQAFIALCSLVCMSRASWMQEVTDLRKDLRELRLLVEAAGLVPEPGDEPERTASNACKVTA
eukprot:6120077-Amphidinium_carterae.1